MAPYALPVRHIAQYHTLCQYGSAVPGAPCPPSRAESKSGRTTRDLSTALRMAPYAISVPHSTTLGIAYAVS
eukprot:2505148-Rhodomonas_salina.2